LFKKNTLSAEGGDKMAGIQDQDARRDFLRRAGKASLGIPATALLLSVTQKKGVRGQKRL
jgi:hypothetical protein